MNIRLDWYGDEVLAQIKAQAWEGIRRAVAFLFQHVLQALNVSNPRPYVTPSLPGEPPRKRTGWLQRNVVYELDEASLTGRVGIGQNARYGLFLEFGTRKMLPRPWLLATAEKLLPQLRALVGGKP